MITQEPVLWRTLSVRTHIYLSSFAIINDMSFFNGSQLQDILQVYIDLRRNTIL